MKILVWQTGKNHKKGKYKIVYEWEKLQESQQASNSRRRGVQNSVHKSYTKSTENLSIFYMVWTGLDGGSMRNLGIVGRKLVSKRGHFPS